MQNFFDDHGIIYEISVSSTHQQNCIVEPKHRYILSMQEPCDFNSPTTILLEGVLTFIYLINHIPTPILSKKTPFVVLYNNHPFIIIYMCLDICVFPPMSSQIINLMSKLKDVFLLVKRLIKPMT